MDMSLDVHIVDAQHVTFPAAVSGHRRKAGGNVTQSARKKDEWTECLVRVKTAQDRAAFAKLFTHFAPRVKAFLMKSGAGAAQAEDVMQEALANVWRKSHLFDPAKASATTWIFTIVRNKQIDVIRKERRPEPEALDWGSEEPDDPADAVAMSQEEKIVREAVAALPVTQREIIEKAYFGDLSHSEIAEVTGLPLGTIKSRIRLALDKLRHEMSIER